MVIIIDAARTWGYSVYTMKKGIPAGKVRRIYKELEKRARILKKIHDSGVTGFYELFAVISKMEEEGVL